MLQVGDVFWLEVGYDDEPTTEVRPVIVVSIDGDPTIVSFVEATRTSLKTMSGKYDRWKVPLFFWREAGLPEPSYAKCHKIGQVPPEVFRPSNYIGSLQPSDLRNVMKKVEEYLNE
jgi:hypothetical protein